MPSASDRSTGQQHPRRDDRVAAEHRVEPRRAGGQEHRVRQRAVGDPQAVEVRERPVGQPLEPLVGGVEHRGRHGRRRRAEDRRSRVLRAQRPADGDLGAGGEVHLPAGRRARSRARRPSRRRRSPRRWCRRRATTSDGPRAAGGPASVRPDLICSIGVRSRPSTSSRSTSIGSRSAEPIRSSSDTPSIVGASGAVDGEQGIGHLGRRGHDVHEHHLGRGADLRRDVPQLVLGHREPGVGDDPLVAAVDPLGAVTHRAVRLRPGLDRGVEDAGQVGEVRLGEGHATPPGAAGSAGRSGHRQVTVVKHALDTAAAVKPRCR